MTLTAHIRHGAWQLLFALPFAVLFGVLIWQAVRDRHRARRDETDAR